jgi:hypothetical protein
MCIRVFHLDRKIDVSGVSGVSDNIASGVVFDDGQVVIHWNTNHSSIGIYRSVEDLLHVHGHQGCTTVVFEDVAEKKEKNGN